jgi:uncharacterized protein
VSIGTEHSELLLVERARVGDQMAFSTLVGRHRALALRLCQRLLSDSGRAEDATQEAVLLAWLTLGRLRNAESFGPWLAGIALHICPSWLRYRAHEAWSLDALLGGRALREPVDWTPGPQLAVEHAELGARVRRAIGGLPPGQRKAVALFYLTGLSQAEVAAALGIQVGAVKARLHKARGHLRDALWELWSEERMTVETGTEFIDVQVEDVRVVPLPEPPGERRVVLLADVGGDRVVPIWVGNFEGDAIVMLLVGAEARRPLTFPFAARVLEAAGGKLTEVRINRLTDETFYAQAVIGSSTGTQIVDSRPSDAIALALETGAPIRLATSVMNVAGIGRAELGERTTPESRSAREHADELRCLVARSRWIQPMVF